MSRASSTDGGIQVGPFPYRVIYGDTDAMGFVYYGTYLRIFEMARSEAMRALGVPYATVESEGIGLPVTVAHVEYHHPARYDDVLLVHMTIAIEGHTRVRFDYRLQEEATGRILTSGYTIHAPLDMKKQRPVRLTARLRALFEPKSGEQSDPDIGGSGDRGEDHVD